jgi:hypothetical protein
MESLSKKNNAFVAKETFPSCNCFIRENRNVAIIYYLRKARSKTKLEKEGFCVRAKDVLQRFISSLFLINFLANSIELYFPNS